MKNQLKSANAPAAIGPYSQGIEKNGIVFVSGQLPIIPSTGELCQGTIREQTRQSMNNVLAILKEANCTAEDIVKTTIYLSDLKNFAEVNAAYAEFFPDAAPARACFQVAALPKNATMEIEAVAVK